MAAATHRSDERLTPRRKALAGLGICLIVPLSAGFGLTVPLPDIVERVAGSFLSGRQLLAFDSKTSDGSRRGVWIVLTPEERKAIRRELPFPASRPRNGADETVVVPLEPGSAGTAAAGSDGGSAAGGVDVAGSVDTDAVAVAASAVAEEAVSESVASDQAQPIESGSPSDPLLSATGVEPEDESTRPETQGGRPAGPVISPEAPGSPPEALADEGAGGGPPEVPGSQESSGGRPADTDTQATGGGRPDDPGGPGQAGGSGSVGGKPDGGKP